MYFVFSFAFYSYSKLRERHAKTLEIAQEEVLTCVGMIMYERLRRVYVSLREEERACQVLAAVGVHALCRSFDMSVEKKQGISNLELLYQEISRAEKAKEHKREQKKLKKKKKKNEKKNSHRICEHSNSEGAEDDEHQGGTTEDEELYEHDVTENGGASDGEAIGFEDEEEEDENDDEDNVVVVVKEVGKALTAGQKMKDVEEDAGVECDHHEEMHEEEVEHDEEDEGKHQKTHTQLQIVQQPNNQQQQQKKKKQKQKQKVKTPQKKNNSTNNNKKKEKLKMNSTSSSADIQEVSKISTIANNNTNTTIATPKCNDCNSPNSECPCESDIKDSGYGSEPLSHGNSRTSSVDSSPEDTSEGSEVSCSDGFCNHEHSVGSSLIADLDDEHHTHHHHHHHHHHHYDDDKDQNHHHDQSFEFGFGMDSCNFFQQHHMNTLSLQQMLVSFIIIFINENIQITIRNPFEYIKGD